MLPLARNAAYALFKIQNNNNNNKFIIIVWSLTIYVDIDMLLWFWPRSPYLYQVGQALVTYIMYIYTW